MQRLPKYLLLLFCSTYLLACTTSRVLYSPDTPNTSQPWLEQIQIGDTLKIIQVGEQAPLTLKLKEITSTSTSLIDDKGKAVPIDAISSVEKIETSWQKTSLLVAGIILVVGAISFKNSVDKIDLGCVSICPGP